MSPFSSPLHYIDIKTDGHPVIVLLHGLGATGDSWALQFPALREAGYRILAPDMRGFGASEYPGKMSIPLMAEDIIALIKSIHSPQPVHLVGISMGGTVSLQIALDAPDLVERLVLISTFPRLRPERPTVWVYFLWRMLLVHSLGLSVQGKAVGARLFPKPEHADFRKQYLDQISQANPRAYRAVMRALFSFDVSDRLSEIRSPTLVVTGGKDTTVPPKNQKPLVEKIPNARQVLFLDAGHVLTVEDPDAFNQVLLDFLSEGESPY